MSAAVSQYKKKQKETKFPVCNFKFECWFTCSSWQEPKCQQWIVQSLPSSNTLIESDTENELWSNYSPPQHSAALPSWNKRVKTSWSFICSWNEAAVYFSRITGRMLSSWARFNLQLETGALTAFSSKSMQDVKMKNLCEATGGRQKRDIKYGNK